MADDVPLLEVRGLTVRFARTGAPAVDNVSFKIGAGETLAVVGESGSGKSVTALAMTRLLPEPPTIYEHGEILLKGRDLLRLPERELRAVRGGQIAYVFQDPMTSLNPVLTVRRQMGEVLALHRPDVPRHRRARDAEIVRALGEVGITEPEKTARRVPAPAQRRDGAAGDDRHGARVPGRRCSWPTSRPRRWTPPCSGRSSSCSGS